ncbi:MAG TPA: hypothetical protein VEI03_24375 [Stellaceae bacterium]|nr:hypothetical protein [Stellaceae bacterium]
MSNDVNFSPGPLAKEAGNRMGLGIAPKGDPKLYLALTLWGEEYRRYFVDFCLASLLAPGNIPAIADKRAARLLLATTEDDWRALQDEPTFVAARKHIAVEHVPFDVPAFSDNTGKMLAMSKGHKLLTRRMFEDRAQGVIIFPDMIAATGFLAKIEELWRGGAAAIMFMNVRFANETLTQELGECGLLRRGMPLALSSRDLVRLTIRHMHSEMARGGFENKCRNDRCESVFWIVGRGQDLVFHCGCWIPLLIDYRTLAAHDDSTFDQWTLDGDYAARNFSDSRELYVVRDTDDLMLVSITPESKIHYSLAPIPEYWFPPVRRSRKILDMHGYLYKVVRLDWLKAELFRQPVRFRGGSATEAEWRKQERRAAQIVRRIERGGTWLDQFWASCVYPLRLCLHVRDFTMVRVRRFRAWRTRNSLGRSL